MREVRIKDNEYGNVLNETGNDIGDDAEKALQSAWGTRKGELGI